MKKINQEGDNLSEAQIIRSARTVLSAKEFVNYKQILLSIFLGHSSNSGVEAISEEHLQNIVNAHHSDAAHEWAVWYETIHFKGGSWGSIDWQTYQDPGVPIGLSEFKEICLTTLETYFQSHEFIVTNDIFMAMTVDQAYQAAENLKKDYSAEGALGDDLSNITLPEKPDFDGYNKGRIDEYREVLISLFDQKW